MKSPHNDAGELHDIRTQLSQPQLRWNRLSTPDCPEWRVRVATTNEEFDALEHDWDALVRDSASSIFQTFTWQRTWWKHFGKHKTLHIVILARGNQLAAIAPLYVETISVLGIAKLTRLAFIGRHTSDYLDVIVREGMHQEAFTRLADHIQTNRQFWDILSLEDIPDRSLTHTALQHAFTFHGIEASTDITELCPRIVLPPAWDEYLAARSNQFRRELRRREKNLSEHFTAEYECIEKETDFDTAFSEFIALHQYRWATKGDAGVFAEPTMRNFHHEVATLLFQQDLVRLYFLRLNGRRVAGVYSFAFGNALSLFLLGMGEAGTASRFSPGRQLMCHTIHDAIRDGKHVVDFMRGGEEYKYALGAVDAPNWTLTAYLQDPTRREHTRRKRDMNLFFSALQKRARRELSSLRQKMHESGFLSRATFDYIRRRQHVLFEDARKKIHAPDKPLYLATRRQHPDTRRTLCALRPSVRNTPE